MIAQSNTPRRTLACTFLHLTAATVALTTIAGAAFAQPGAPGTWVSGLHHVALGGATLGNPTDRRLPVNNIGSSGQDGVSIQCDSSRGVGCAVDLTQLLATPGAQCKASYSDLSYMVKATHTIHATGGGPGGGAGGGVHVFDFSAMSAISVRWVVRDSTGVVMAEGTHAGPTLVAEVAPTGPGPFNPLHWTMRTRLNELEATLQSLGLLARCTSGPITLSGLTSTPVSGASSIECFPIICITSPCPGGWTGVSSMAVTASGVSSLDVANAGKEIKIESATVAGGTFQRTQCFATNTLHVEEPCAGLPENCPPAQSAMHITGWGTTGDDCLTIDFSEMDRVDGADAARKRDHSVRTASIDYDFVPALAVPPGQNPGMVFESQGRKWGNGHVTLMKLYDDGEIATGARLLRCDASGMGSSECVVSFLNAAGTVLSSATLSATAPVRIDSTPARISTNMTIERITMSSPGNATMPGGTPVPGVASITFKPVNPKVAIGIDRVCCMGKHIASANIGRLAADHTAASSGITHNPIGPVTLTDDPDRHLRVSNIGSTGQDGVEIVCGGAFGASCDIALSDILSHPGTFIRIRDKGWDGTIKGRTQCTSVSGGAISCVQDFSTTGATAMHWQALSADGVVLAEGDHPSALLDYSCVLMPSGGLPPSSMSLKHGGYDMKKAKSRSETSCINGLCRLSIPGRPPIDSVATLRCDVYPPAAMLKHLEGTQSIVITGNAPGIDVSNPTVCNWSFGATNPVSVGTNGGGLSQGRATLAAEFTVPATFSPQLVASNIGSSGQDGVAVGIPSSAATDFSLNARAKKEWLDDWQTPNAVAAGSSMEMTFRNKDGLTGHVTLIKFVILEDPNSPVPAELHSCDATARGALTCTATFVDSSGVTVGTATVSPTDTVKIFACAPHMHQYGVHSNGHGRIITQCPGTMTLSTGVSFANVASVTFSPNAPALGPQLPLECLVTGMNLDSITVENMQLDLPSCLADLGRQGGLVGGDGHYDNNDFVAFIDLFFNGSSGADLGQQGGIPGQDGHLDNNDFVIFIDYFFQGCN
jgi:hypothetical protein